MTDLRNQLETKNQKWKEKTETMVIFKFFNIINEVMKTY